MATSEEQWLVSGPEHPVDAAAVGRELHDAWLDFGSAQLDSGQLVLSGDRDVSVNASGKVRRGRFRWTLTFEGVNTFEFEDPHGLAGLMICSVERDGDRLAFVGCTPGRLVVDGFTTAQLHVSPHRLPKRKRTGDDYVSPPPPRGMLVDAVESVVHAQLLPFGASAARVETVWSPRAGMWFVEVEPAAPGAATVSIGVEGDELVVSLPHAHWEIWRSKSGPSVLAALASDLEAIFAGRIEGAGVGSDRFVHLLSSDGKVRSVGSVHLPVPWRWRRRSTYHPYGAAVNLP